MTPETEAERIRRTLSAFSRAMNGPRREEFCRQLAEAWRNTEERAALKPTGGE